MPKDLKRGVVYVSEQFGAAAHLCACGCGLWMRLKDQDTARPN